jgi:hypothetical protein
VSTLPIAAGTAALLIGATGASAATLNLTTAGSSGFINGALYQQVPDQSTGTGVIDPFLRVQRDGIEEGFNTDASNPPLDAKGGIWTHSIRVSDLDLQVVNGISYYRFLLDINEVNTEAQRNISLDELQIYTGNAGASPASLAAIQGASTLRYDLDGPLLVDNNILLNYGLNPGSGAGDMFAYIPAALFVGAGANDFVYLYSLFGLTAASGGDASDGFEEWALIRSTQPIPEPTTVFGGLFLLGGLGWIERSRIKGLLGKLMGKA